MAKAGVELKEGDRAKVVRITNDGMWSDFGSPERFLGMCGRVREVRPRYGLKYTLNMDNGETGIRFTEEELEFVEEVEANG